MALTDILRSLGVGQSCARTFTFSAATTNHSDTPVDRRRFVDRSSVGPSQTHSSSTRRRWPRKEGWKKRFTGNQQLVGVRCSRSFLVVRLCLVSADAATCLWLICEASLFLLGHLLTIWYTHCTCDMVFHRLPNVRGNLARLPDGY